MSSSSKSIQNISQVKLSNLYITSLHVNTSAALNRVFLSPGECRDSTNSYNMVLTQPLILNPLNIGVNGLDSLTIPVGPQHCTLYSIFLIGDSSGVLPTACIGCAMISSVNNNQPIMPTGYNIKRLVGYAMCDSTISSPVTFFGSISFGNGNYRKFVLNALDGSHLLIGSTSSTVHSGDIDMSYIVPHVFQTPVSLSLYYLASAAGHVGIVQSENYTAQNATVPMTPNIEVAMNYQPSDPTEYLISFATVGTLEVMNLHIQGFDYCV